MSKKKRKPNIDNAFWLSGISTTILGIGGVLIIMLSISKNTSEISNIVMNKIGGFATLISLLGVVLYLVIVFKAEDKKQIIIAIGGVLLMLIIGFLAYFAYWLSGGAN